MEQINLVVSNPTEDFALEIKKYISSKKNVSVMQTSDFVGNLGGFFTKKTPSVLVIGPDWDPEESLEAATSFSMKFPYVSIILAVKIMDKDVLQRSIKVGIKDVIQLPIKLESFLQSLDTAACFSSSILSVLAKMPEVETDKKQGQVLTIFGTKGGVGKTVIATNLAAYLAKQNNKVYLLDLDLQFGDVAIMLKIEPKYSVADAIIAGDNLDKDMLDCLIVGHEQTGLNVLPAPVNPESIGRFDEEQLIRIIDILKNAADYIIIDTPASIDKNILDILNFSDRILLVSTVDLPSIKSSKVALGLLQILNIPSDKINFILNRADSKVGVRLDDIEKSVGKKINSKIPSDRLIPRSVNMGVPFVSKFPRSEVSKSLQKLSYQAVGKMKETAS